MDLDKDYQHQLDMAIFGFPAKFRGSFFLRCTWNCVCKDLSALPLPSSAKCVSVNVHKCPVHCMATWTRHLLTKVQQMKLIKSIFRCCAWLEKEWHWVSLALCLGMTCGGWCLRSFHASQAQSSPSITWMQSWGWIKPWESKGWLEHRQRFPALTYQQMCTEHGVTYVGSGLVRKILC